MSQWPTLQARWVWRAIVEAENLMKEAGFNIVPSTYKRNN